MLTFSTWPRVSSARTTTESASRTKKESKGKQRAVELDSGSEEETVRMPEETPEPQAFEGLPRAIRDMSQIRNVRV